MRGYLKEIESLNLFIVEQILIDFYGEVKLPVARTHQIKSDLF